MANSNLPRRIIKETQRFLNEPALGISASPPEENMRYFNVMILGPAQSPYQDGVFKLELFLPEEYPMAVDSEKKAVEFLCLEHDKTGGSLHWLLGSSDLGLVAAIRGHQIIIGNVGRSRCIISRNGQAIELTTDHQPSNLTEPRGWEVVLLTGPTCFSVEAGCYVCLF